MQMKMQLQLQLELLLIWILNALALLAVANFVPGIHVDGFGSALIAAFFLGLVNTLIRPLLLLLTLPVTLVTLDCSSSSSTAHCSGWSARCCAVLWWTVSGMAYWVQCYTVSSRGRCPQLLHN